MVTQLTGQGWQAMTSRHISYMTHLPSGYQIMILNSTTKVQIASIVKETGANMYSNCGG